MLILIEQQKPMFKHVEKLIFYVLYCSKGEHRAALGFLNRKPEIYSASYLSRVIFRFLRPSLLLYLLCYPQD